MSLGNYLGISTRSCIASILSQSQSEHTALEEIQSSEEIQT